MIGELRQLFNEGLESLYHDERPLPPGACPFVPYVGENYETAPLRVLIVGKATYGWGDNEIETIADATRNHADYDRLSSIAKDFMRVRVRPFYGKYSLDEKQDTKLEDTNPYCSAFWNTIFRIMGALLDNDFTYERTRSNSDRRFKSIAWSNVFKLAEIGGNPNNALRDLSSRHLNTLAREIEILMPNLILFPTGVGYDRYISRALAIPDLPSEPVHLFAAGGAKAVRTRHYMGMTGTARDTLIDQVKSIVG